MNGHRRFRSSVWLLSALFVGVAACVFVSCERPAPPPGEEDAKKEASEPVHYTIRGRVTLAGGEDPTGTTVFCAGTSYAAYCDREGGYMISDVPHGRYVVMAQRIGFERTELGETILLPVAAGAGPTEVEIPLVELPRDKHFLTAMRNDRPVPGTVIGRVVSTDGDDSDQARVSLVGTGWQALTGSNGVFTIAGVDPGAYQLLVQRSGYEAQERRVLVRPGEVTRLARPVELRPEVAVVEGRGTILGEVLFLGPGGQVTDPVQGATVGIVENSRTTEVGKDGSFAFDNLEPGLYTLIADVSGFRLRNKVQVRVGEEPATAIMFLQNAQDVGEERGGVAGKIRLADASETPLVGIVVALTGSSHMGVTDASGAFRLTEVPAGTYSLFCSREGFETLQITGIEIEAGKVVDLGTLEMSREADPPRVVYASPGDGADGITIEPTVALRLGFSHRMNLRAVRDALQISPPVTWQMRRASTESGAADAVEILIESAGSASPLQFNTKYTLTLSDSATDVEGVGLEEPYRMRFSTGGLRILRVLPPDRASGVEVSGRSFLEVYFNGAVDDDTITDRTVDISPRPTAMGHSHDLRTDRQSGWSVLRMRMTWQYDTEYTVTFRSGLRTPDGVRFDQSPYRVRFKTEPIPQFGQ